MDIDVVAAGHICLDIIPAFQGGDQARIAELLTPGKLIDIGVATLATGGSVSNTGLALAKLGMNVRLMGKIGDDYFGKGIIGLLEEYHAGDSMSVVPGAQTSYSVILALPGSDRVILHNPGANHTFTAEDITDALVRRARLFHFGYPPLMRSLFENDGAELVKLFSRVKSYGVTTSLDMALPDEFSEAGQADWPAILQKVLPFVDIFMPSVEEILYMLDRAAYRRLAETATANDPLAGLDMEVLSALGARLLEMGVKVLAIKCGARGYYVRTGNVPDMGAAHPAQLSGWLGRELFAESFHVPAVVSAAGAGDNSVAGFLAAFLRGCTIEDCVRTACAVGAQNVMVPDAVSGVKSWDETREMLMGWTKNRLSAPGKGWVYDDALELWVKSAKK